MGSADDYSDTQSYSRNEMTLHAPNGRAYIGTPDGWQRIGRTMHGITLQMRDACDELAKAAIPIVRTVTMQVQMHPRTIRRFGLAIAWPTVTKAQVMDMRAWSRRKGRRK